MSKIAAMGDKDSVYGFASIGLDVFPTDDVKEAAGLLKMFAGENYAVVYVTEALAFALGSEIDKYRESVTPAIILIPGVKGNTGQGLSNVSRYVEQAVGSDIVS